MHTACTERRDGANFGKLAGRVSAFDSVYTSYLHWVHQLRSQQHRVLMLITALCNLFYGMEIEQQIKAEKEAKRNFLSLSSITGLSWQWHQSKLMAFVESAGAHKLIRQPDTSAVEQIEKGVSF